MGVWKGILEYLGFKINFSIRRNRNKIYKWKINQQLDRFVVFFDLQNIGFFSSTQDKIKKKLYA